MILEAARWTGSAKNRQDWSFVVLDDPDAKRAVAAAGDFTGPMLAASVAIAIVQEPGGYEFDSGRLAQNIMLAADAVVASCPVTLHRDGEAASALGLPSDRDAGMRSPSATRATGHVARWRRSQAAVRSGPPEPVPLTDRSCVCRDRLVCLSGPAPVTASWRPTGFSPAS